MLSSRILTRPVCLRPPKRFLSSTPTAADSLMKLGDLKANGLCNWTPPGILESAMEYVHVSTQLPWWATIAVTAVSLRLLLSPLTVSMQRNAAIMQNDVNPIAKDLMARYQTAKSIGDMDTAQQSMKELMQVYEKYGVHPLASMKNVLIMAPVTMSMFFALRDISMVKLPALQEGGMLWFTDLTAPDPYYALPVMAAASFLLVVEKGMETGGPNAASPGGSGTSKEAMKNVMRVLGLVGIPVMGSFPAGLSLYWFTNSLCTMSLSLALQNRRVRDIVGIPQIRNTTTSEDKTMEVVTDNGEIMDKNQSIQNIMAKLQPQVKKLANKEMGFMEGMRAVTDVVMKEHPDHPLIKRMQKPSVQSTKNNSDQPLQQQPWNNKKKSERL